LLAVNEPESRVLPMGRLPDASMPQLFVRKSAQLAPAKRCMVINKTGTAQFAVR
jgi:hypothetical protein